VYDVQDIHWLFSGWNEALSKVQGDDPGDIRAKIQVGTQQNAKQRSVVQGRNSEVKQNGEIKI
jgi:hypothetical protein